MNEVNFEILLKFDKALPREKNRIITNIFEETYVSNK